MLPAEPWELGLSGQLGTPLVGHPTHWLPHPYPRGEGRPILRAKEVHTGKTMEARTRDHAGPAPCNCRPSPAPEATVQGWAGYDPSGHQRAAGHHQPAESGTLRLTRQHRSERSAFHPGAAHGAWLWARSQDLRLTASAVPQLPGERLPRADFPFSSSFCYFGAIPGGKAHSTCRVPRVRLGCSLGGVVGTQQGVSNGTRD